MRRSFGRDSRVELASYGRVLPIVFVAAFAWAVANPAVAQERLSVSTSVLDAPGGMVLTGVDFRYRVTYACDLVSLSSCDDAVVTVVLPPEVVYQSVVFPPSDVVSGMHDPATRTVTFTLQPSVPPGQTGDLDIRVRFPAGSTPNGTITTMLAMAVNSTGTDLVPQTADLPPVTAKASPMVELIVALEGGFIDDCPTGSTYHVTIRPKTTSGSLNLLEADELVLNLPAGVTNVMSADGGVYDTPANTVTWTLLGEILVGSSVTVSVDLTFADPPFSDGQMVTSFASAVVDPLGEPDNLAVGPIPFGHVLTQFMESPDAFVGKFLAGPAPAAGQSFSYFVPIRNTGNIPLDTLVVVDDGDGAGSVIDPGIDITSVSTGTYSPPPASITIKVTTDLMRVLMGTYPPGNTLDVANMLGMDERATRIEWVFNGGAPVGMVSTSLAVVRATVDAGLPVGTTIDNHVTASWTATVGTCSGSEETTSGSETSNVEFDVHSPFVLLFPHKQSSSSGPFTPGDTISYTLFTQNQPTASDPATGVVITDLLPGFLDFQSGTEMFMADGTGVSVSMFEAIDNYNGTGRSLLRWTLTGDLDPGKWVRVTFDAKLALGAVYGFLANEFGASIPSGPTQQICTGSSVTDANDLDGDGDATDRLCTAERNVTVAAIAGMRSEKLVRGQGDTAFAGALSVGTTVPGGGVDWRVQLQNIQTVPVESLVVIDIFPFVGDTGVRDITPRLSQFRPLLIEQIVPPPSGTVFYSLSGNPCRPEVGGPATGCETPNWSPIPPVPITDTQSIKIEFGDRILSPLDLLSFDWRMIVPADARVDGSTANNSFAFGANRQDDDGFLSAEPNKVGIEATWTPPAPDDAILGNFVWLDADGDGLQGVSEVGINNVPVQLLDPGPDGMPRTGDDIEVLSSITSDDAMGSPGWYQFAALSPGDYYVRFFPPPNFDVTIRGAGSDPALDSDADPASACTDVVTLGPSENNPDIDLGLLVPTTASLGNYVWFDRDGDGVQNEPPLDGVNGTTVRLFIDDGDGIPEPGNDDGAPILVTVTGDDTSGNPGLYTFTDLPPGTPIFVQVILPASASGFTTRDAGGDDIVDSDVDLTNGTTPVVTLVVGEDNRTLDAGLVLPTGPLSVGNVVWCDEDGNGVIDAAGDDDGIYDPLVPEAGVNGVRLNLYRDVNNDGLAQADEFFGATISQTLAGKDGRYRFDNLPAGDFIVVVVATAFATGAPLEGKVTSTGNEPTPDPDDDVDNDDNGDPFGGSVASQAITLSVGREPTSDADDDLEVDQNINFSLDFGFVPGVARAFDFGDNPDVGAGTGTGNYQTVALDGGAVHEIGDPMGPFLGNCVDNDDGTLQNIGGDADDLAGAVTTTIGTCLTAGDDEDGVTFSSTELTAGGTVDITVTSRSATPCVTSGWIDWNRDGVFDNFAPEKILSDVVPGVFPAIAVPATADQGVLYARFRCSSAGGDSPVGAAPNGEVEDYRLQVAGVDFGDAPDVPYGTLRVSNGPLHGTNPDIEMYLGACVDTEADGQPNTIASGDDTGIGNSIIGTCVSAGDDEDGVIFNTTLVPGQMAQVTIIASMLGRLDAWIDFDGAGGFTGADQIATDQALMAGPNVLTVLVPASAIPGATYARFRYSTAGGLMPSGMAADGEIEDYSVLITGTDYGDAPDSYLTTMAAGGPSHAIDLAASLFLGTCVDTEPDAAMPLDATGDDVSAGTGVVGNCVADDDEDGVTFDTAITACRTAFVTVTAGAAGLLDGWIDFDRDGSFATAGEQVFTSLKVSAAANSLSFAVPCTVSPGSTFARFRLSSMGGLGFGGAATDGEVEDYPVRLDGLDYGDAPDSYATSIAAGGPSHAVNPSSNIYLGACVDTEDDGQPVNTGNPADGDDLGRGTSELGRCVGNDDEDGIIFDTMIVACGTSILTVTASQPGMLDGWIDFDGTGTFDSSEQIFTGEPVSTTPTQLPYAVPCDTVTAGVSYARFRISTAGGLGAVGPAMDGEVEDYDVVTKGLDFGDAPAAAGYPTVLAEDGARHVVLPVDNPTLGMVADTEPDGQPDPAHAGDDRNGTPDDEDGVEIAGGFVEGGAPVDVTVTAGATGGLLNAWIDWNVDGDWDDAGEQIANSWALSAGAVEVLSVAAPPDAIPGTTCARFRIASAGGTTPTGLAMDGEIEDYPVAINAEEPMIGVAKELLGITFLHFGEYALDFRLLVENAGNVPLANIQVMAPLAIVFIDAGGFDIGVVTSTDFSVNPAFDGDSDPNLLDGSDTLAIGASGVITLQVILRPGQNPGPYLCTSTASGDSPSGTPVADDSQEGDNTDPNGDGDPNDNNEPTSVLIPLVPIEIPTLGEWGLLALALLLAFAGLRAVRPRRG